MKAPRRALYAACALLVAGAAWVASSPTPRSNAVSTTLTPTADATIQQDLATTNLGARKTLRVVSDAKGSGADQWAYLMFDLGTSSAPVATATLRLYVTAPSANPPTVSAVSTSWTETDLTWSSHPEASGKAISSHEPAATDTWINYDVASLLPASGPAAFVLQPVSADGVVFSSRSGVHPPELIINGAGATTTASPTTSVAATTTAEPATTTTTDVAAPQPTVDPRIVAVGDIACDPAAPDFSGGNGTTTACQQKATSDLVVGGGYAAVLPLGDLQYSGGAYDAFVGSYDLSWGRLKSITHPAPGNHEYGTHGAAGYYRYFGTAAGDPQTGYYSYDIGTWHLVALNSNCSDVSCAKGSAQETWLRADLAAHPAKCTLVYWHHPLYSSGEHGDILAMADLYQAAYDGGADLALAGHDHDYERFAPQNAVGQIDATRGIREFVVGTGGKNHYGIAAPHAAAHPNSQVRNDSTFGVLELTLHANSYDWKFVPIAGEAFTDSGTQRCH
jgi:hypothetical protein